MSFSTPTKTAPRAISKPALGRLIALWHSLRDLEATDPTDNTLIQQALNGTTCITSLMQNGRLDSVTAVLSTTGDTACYISSMPGAVLETSMLPFLLEQSKQGGFSEIVSLFQLATLLKCVSKRFFKHVASYMERHLQRIIQTIIGPAGDTCNPLLQWALKFPNIPQELARITEVVPEPTFTDRAEGPEYYANNNLGNIITVPLDPMYTEFMRRMSFPLKTSLAILLMSHFKTLSGQEVRAKILELMAARDQREQKQNDITIRLLEVLHRSEGKDDQPDDRWPSTIEQAAHSDTFRSLLSTVGPEIESENFSSHQLHISDVNKDQIARENAPLKLEAIKEWNLIFPALANAIMEAAGMDPNVQPYVTWLEIYLAMGGQHPIVHAAKNEKELQQILTALQRVIVKDSRALKIAKSVAVNARTRRILFAIRRQARQNRDRLAPHSHLLAENSLESELMLAIFQGELKHFTSMSKSLRRTEREVMDTSCHGFNLRPCDIAQNQMVAPRACSGCQSLRLHLLSCEEDEKTDLTMTEAEAASETIAINAISDLAVYRRKRRHQLQSKSPAKKRKGRSDVVRMLPL